MGDGETACPALLPYLPDKAAPHPSPPEPDLLRRRRDRAMNDVPLGDAIRLLSALYDVSIAVPQQPGMDGESYRQPRMGMPEGKWSLAECLAVLVSMMDELELPEPRGAEARKFQGMTLALVKADRVEMIRVAFKGHEIPEF
jgi:hypothetical protein